jgi:hypothetical protein
MLPSRLGWTVADPLHDRTAVIESANDDYGVPLLRSP